MASGFAVNIRAFAEKAKGRADLVVRKVSLDIFSRVVLKTPVDTGRARANWGCAIAPVAPPISATNATDKGGGKTIAAIQAAVAGAKLGDRIWLVNGVPYIVPLEYGHSKQAPAGMVRETLREYPGIVAGATSAAASGAAAE